MDRNDHVMLIASSDWSMMHYRIVLIDAYLPRGLDVSVVAHLSPDHCNDLQRRSVKAVAVPIEGAGQNPIRDLVYLVRLVRVLRAAHPDVVHLFNTKPILYAAIAAKIAGVEGIVASVTGRGILASEKMRWLRWLVRPLMKAAIAGRTRCIFQNLDDRAWYLEQRLMDEARAFYIPGSGVDTERLQPGNQPPEMRKTFVLAARMLKSKGIEDFVEAARIVTSRHPDARFMLFGGSKQDYKSKNPDFIERDWLEELNREGIVSWLGFRKPPEVEDAMQNAAAVVLPSYYPEGVPRALIEGAAAGAPIITTDAPGCRDTVKDGRSGYLVPPKSPEALAEAMSKLLDDPERIRTMGEASRQLAETFDSRLIIERTLEVYEDALGRPLRHGAAKGTPAGSLTGQACVANSM